MIISCPDCHTKYRASAESIGVNGRTVRCANCATTWFVPSEAAELTLDKLALADIERDEGEAFAQESRVASQAVSGLAGQSKVKDSLGRSGTENVNLGDVETGLRGAHSDMRERTERKRSRRRLRNVMFIWLVPLVILCAAAAFAYFNRQAIVDKFPKSASMYKALGIEVSGPGLTLTPPSTRYAEIDGKPVLIVEGAVRNISQDARDIPLIALSLHNSSGEQLAAWNVDVERARLAAGERAAYISQYPNPPIDAAGLYSRFADELEITLTPLELTSPQK